MRTKATTTRAIVVAVGVLAGFCSVAAASSYGINAHLPSEAVLEQVAAAGIGWIRIDVNWYQIELEQDRFNWRWLDRMIEGANGRGLKVYATLAYTPGWATSGTPVIGVPDNPEDWTDFCYRVAARYRGRVAAWGLWNEPNLDHFWEGSRDDYINLIMRPGAEVIHVADPDALVAGPELAHLSSARWDEWLYDCVRAGQYVLDVVTHHNYPSNASANEVFEDLNHSGSLPWETPSVKEVLQSAGWWGRPFWLTETGVRSSEFSQYKQAGFLENLLYDWFSEFPEGTWMGRVFIYQIADDPAYPDRTYGLLGPEPALWRKLAYFRYREVISTMASDHATFDPIGRSVFLKPEVTTEATVVVRNSGSTTWLAESGYSLIATFDEGEMVDEIAPIPEGVEVRPGQAHTFDLTVTPPTNSIIPGKTKSYEVILRMNREGSGNFGEPLVVDVVVSPFDPPAVTDQPSMQIVNRGDAAVFSVEAQGTETMMLQWLLNGRELEDGPDIDGATESELTVRPNSEAWTGEYICRVTDRSRVVYSQPAPLYLITADTETPRRLGAGVATPPTIRR